MITKKFFIFGTVAAVLSFAVALGAKSYRTTHNTLFYANLEALANPEGDNGDGGGGGTNPGGGGGSTPESGGSTLIGGFFSDCVDGGVETGTFTHSGTITILGFSLSGSRGDVYTVVWERCGCTEAAGHTCDTSRSGMRIISSNVD